MKASKNVNVNEGSAEKKEADTQKIYLKLKRACGHFNTSLLLTRYDRLLLLIELNHSFIRCRIKTPAGEAAETENYLKFALR